jgi:hypothetical protein
MKKYLFATHEGRTEGPNPDVEVENMQVIGVVEEVSNEDEALKKLLLEIPWIWDSGFNVAEFIAYEIV